MDSVDQVDDCSEYESDECYSDSTSDCLDSDPAELALRILHNIQSKDTVSRIEHESQEHLVRKDYIADDCVTLAEDFIVNTEAQLQIRSPDIEKDSIFEFAIKQTVPPENRPENTVETPSSAVIVKDDALRSSLQREDSSDSNSNEEDAIHLLQRLSSTSSAGSDTLTMASTNSGVLQAGATHEPTFPTPISPKSLPPTESNLGLQHNTVRSRSVERAMQHTTTNCGNAEPKPGNAGGEVKRRDEKKKSTENNAGLYLSFSI
jgi:hypothetical protein